MRDHLSIYYNGALPESRTLMGYAESLGVPVKAIDVRKTPLTPMQWLGFAGKLETDLAELVHPDEVAKIDDGVHDLSQEDWARILHKEPELLRKPIGQRRERVAVLHTASDLMQL